MKSSRSNIIVNNILYLFITSIRDFNFFFNSIMKYHICSILQTRKVEKLPLYHIFQLFCVQYKLNILVFYMYPLIRVVGLLFQFKIVIINLYIDTNKCDVIYWKILYYHMNNAWILLALINVPWSSIVLITIRCKYVTLEIIKF